MTQVASRNRDVFTSISHPAVFNYRPSARVVCEPLLERSCRLVACSKMRNHVPRTVPVKLIDRNKETADDNVWLRQYNSKKSQGQFGISAPTHCAVTKLKNVNSDLSPWKGECWLDVSGKSMTLNAKDKVIVKRYPDRSKVPDRAIAALLKPIPKSHSECKLHTKIGSPCSCHLRYSESGVSVKAWKRAAIQSVKPIRIPSERDPGSPPSKNYALHKNKPFSKVTFAPNSKLRGAETSYSYIKLQTKPDYHPQRRAPSEIRGFVEEGYIPWRQDKEREKLSDNSFRIDSHSAIQRLCCSPVSNMCVEGDYIRQVQLRQDDLSDVNCIPASYLEHYDFKSHQEPLSTTMLSAHAQGGPWASAVNKTHYILQWLDDVSSKGQT